MGNQFALYSRRTILGLFCILFSNGCAKEPAPIRSLPSDRLSPVPQISERPLESRQLRPSLLDLPPKKQIRTKPIPDRLLVQIRPSEIADPFRRELAGCRPRQFVELGLIPAELSKARIQYRGVTREGEATFSVHAPGRLNESAIRRAFRRGKGELLDVRESGAQDKTVQHIMVAIDSREIAGRWPNLCEPNYFHLKKSSSLHHVFQEIGAISMRRVFRSLEQPENASRGYFTVRKYKAVLEAAKAENSDRTARSYKWADLSNERAASEDVRAVQVPFSIEAMAAERIVAKGSPKLQKRSVYDEAIKRAGFPEKTDLKTPDNMENWFLLRLKPGVDLRTALSRLRQLSTVQRASLDFPFKPAQVDDPEWDDQWGLRNTGNFLGSGGGLAGFDIGIEDAWGAPPAPRRVIVAVIDTGINENLDELSTRLWTNPGEFDNGQPTPGDDHDCNGYADDVHGITTYDRFAIDYSGSDPCALGGPSIALEPHATSVAGVIAAQTNNQVGIAGTAGTEPVELMNITLGLFSDRLWPPGWSEFAEAMFYAISPHPDGSVRGADVVNMSFGTSHCGYLGFQSIYAALDSGLVLVGAAGNDSIRFGVDEDGILGVFPGSVPGIITVGGATRDGQWWPSSNYGPGIDLVAPADEIRTLTYDPDNPAQTSTSIVTASGTSLAAAFVSGTAVVILGRYPDQLTAPLMRHWLRAKATDIQDPLGDGSSHVGDDEWTGAGLLNAGDATTDLLIAADQPIVVELAVPRSKNFRGYYGWGYPIRPLSVGGQPNLGIRVLGSTLSNWSLSYGVGDAPTTWTDIPVSPSNLTQQEVDFEWVTGEGAVSSITPPGRNFLDTDALANKQVYTIRLKAENNAGTKFEIDNYMIPTRAEILFPPQNWTLVPKWGWLPVAGFIDTRPSSNFGIGLYDALNQPVWDTGSQVLWQPHEYTPPHLGVRTPTVAHPLLSNHSSYFASGGGFPAASSGMPEGWHEYRLSVNWSAGSELDAVRFYVDASHFDTAFWDLKHESVTIETQYGPLDLANEYALHLHNRASDALLVSEASNPTAPRLFLQAGKSVMGLDRNGALAWEKRPLQGPPYHYDFSFSWNMVVSDVDGDGSREILYAANELTSIGGGQHKLRISLHSADNGMPFNGNWPKEFARSRNQSPGHLAAADVLGDSNKEIILAEPRWFYYGVPEDELAPAKIHIFGLDGNELDSREFPNDITHVGPLETADIDGDGKDEMVLVGTGQILKGDGTFLPGWDTAGQSAFRALVKTGAGAAVDLLVLEQGELVLKAPDGTARNGWPIQADGGSIAVAQIVAGGAEEIIACGDLIKVFDSAGARVASVPDITIDGTCGRVLAEDVDNDGVVELLALLYRFKDDPAPDERLGTFLEAYKLDGTRLADSDSRWPVVVAPQDFWSSVRPAAMNRHLVIGDVDGDTRPEVVQVLPKVPYGMDRSSAVPSARVEVLQLQ